MIMNNRYRSNSPAKAQEMPVDCMGLCPDFCLAVVFSLEEGEGWGVCFPDYPSIIGASALSEEDALADAAAILADTLRHYRMMKAEYGQSSPLMSEEQIRHHHYFGALASRGRIIPVAINKDIVLR